MLELVRDLGFDFWALGLELSLREPSESDSELDSAFFLEAAEDFGEESVDELSDDDISVGDEEGVSEGENNNKDLNKKDLREKRNRKPPKRYSDSEENKRVIEGETTY